MYSWRRWAGVCVQWTVTILRARTQCDHTITKPPAASSSGDVQCSPEMATIIPRMEKALAKNWIELRSVHVKYSSSSGSRPRSRASWYSGYSNHSSRIARALRKNIGFELPARPVVQQIPQVVVERPHLRVVVDQPDEHKQPQPRCMGRKRIQHGRRALANAGSEVVDQPPCHVYNDDRRRRPRYCSAEQQERDRRPGSNEGQVEELRELPRRPQASLVVLSVCLHPCFRSGLEDLQSQPFSRRATCQGSPGCRTDPDGNASRTRSRRASGSGGPRPRPARLPAPVLPARR